MKSTMLAVAFALVFAPVAAFAQGTTPAKPAQAQATPAKPAAPAQAKVDCAKKENAAKDECKAAVKKP
jgi:hypothetical protein